MREDPARAEAILEDLGDLFRHALVDPGSGDPGREMALARRYLDIEQVRFGERLHRTVADPAAGGPCAAPHAPAVGGDAVKHGVEPSAAGRRSRSSTQRRGGTVVIKVTNTVPAGQGRRGRGVAQNNVRDRLRLLHDVQGQFQAALKDGVYQVRMEVPV